MHTPQRTLLWTIAVATLARVTLNTARRFAYPFAPALSRGLDVPLPAITSIIALNQGTGLLGLIFGPLADQWGYRMMLLSALSVLIGGMLAGGLFPFYVVVLAALCLAGVGKTMFDPAIQAYASSQVPYQRRGFVIGIY
jgi:MFS family permease